MQNATAINGRRLKGFCVVALTPPGIPNPDIAIAAGRAGGIGIMDLEFRRDWTPAASALAKLTRYANAFCGLRMAESDADALDAITAKRTRGVAIAVLARFNPETLSATTTRLHKKNLLVWLEARSLEEGLQGVAAGVDGLIAKGSESGGWCGNETAFILAQRMIRRTALPIYVQGGIGLHTSAACMAAGAAGVVLDAQLWLTPESSLPSGARNAIEKMDGSETRCLSISSGDFFRVYYRPGAAAAELLQEQPYPAENVSFSAIEVESRRQTVLGKCVGFEDLQNQVMPVGPDAALAARLTRRFGTTGGIIHGVYQAISQHIETAQRVQPLTPNSPLAQAHGTRYPIVQGPMASISDNGSFLSAVAQTGALPFMALGRKNRQQLEPLFEQAAQKLKNHTWGVGLLGFGPEQVRKEQMELIRFYRPPFAIISGGRPDQALALERAGIFTYLHVPSPDLLKLFVRRGLRRFIFEGRECGGHIGPRSSFVLWEQMIDALLDELSPENAADLHLLFAGGIHDSVSAAMVAVLSAPLSARGMRVGVLMGTAYLLTDEAVSTGAIVKRFQGEALRCGRTVELETALGHAFRCADTPFVGFFQREKQRLLREAVPAEQMQSSLEKLSMGRLRVAATGLNRNPTVGSGGKSKKYHRLTSPRQSKDGCYMIGQLAVLHDRTFSMEALHEDVSVRSAGRLSKILPAAEEFRPLPVRVHPSDVAIVGMACMLPKALDLQTYWMNILGKVDAITEVPEGRWQPSLFYDQDPQKRDKVYSRWGGFLDPVPFNPLKYGIPPKSLSSVEPLQLLTLEVVGAALRDAGYAQRSFNRERTSVILGAGGGVSDLMQSYVVRSNMPTFFQDPAETILKFLPEWTEDSFPGILTNVAAGRVANRFDLGGVNYTVDAACASSLAAVYQAVTELENKNSDMVIVGGCDTAQNPFSYLCFSKTQALSPTGRCRAFDESADGTVISEGLAALVLKRLGDAERDGDRIYAVIKGVGASSDGSDKSLTAPKPEGQQRALRRAYAKAGFSPASVGLVEAHGTGTVAGDRSETETLKTVFEANGAGRAGCALGSVKSMIGHTKCTAGVAGMIKTALALYHRVLPPTMGIARPNASLEDSPFYLNTTPRPWIKNSQSVPRRAGVSAFGFGGTNFHVAIEEYTGAFLEPETQASIERWPSELFLWPFASRSQLIDRIEPLIDRLEGQPVPQMRGLAYDLWLQAGLHEGSKLAIVANSLEDLIRKLISVKEKLERTPAGEALLIEEPGGVFFSEASSVSEGKIAFLFPGQGAQYPGMLTEYAVFFEEVRKQYELADHALRNCYEKPLSAFVFPPPAFSPEAETSRREALTNTHVAQPAIGAANMGLLQLLGSLGIYPDMVAGHSYGEYAALCAAGVFDVETLYRLSEIRGRLISEAAGPGVELGAMAAVKATPAKTRELVADLDQCWLANFNSPQQTIISGSSDAIVEAMRRCQEQGLSAVKIAVAAAFHSPKVATVQERLSGYLKEIAFKAPRIPVYSNALAEPYPRSKKKIAAVLVGHLLQPVRWTEQVEAMYAAGARVFVEVGPGDILTNLTRQILGKRNYLALPLDPTGASNLHQLQCAVGRLAAAGVRVNIDRFFSGRKVHRAPLQQPAGVTDKTDSASSTWWIKDGKTVPPERLRSKKSDAPLPLKTKPLKEKHTMAESSKPDRNTKITGHPVSGVDQIMLHYQRLMGRFLEVQHEIMSAYLTGHTRASDAEARRMMEDRVSGGHDDSLARAFESTLATEPAGEGLEATEVPTAPVTATSANDPVVSPHSQPVHPGQAAVSSAAPDFDAIVLCVREVVSERTGYPAEMLDLDLNIEADLGIDSIKRVEILGTLQQTYFPNDDSATDNETGTVVRFKTLRDLTDWLSAKLANAPPAAAHTHEPTAESLPVSPMAPKIDILERIREVIAERTGYPAEMLDPSLLLEADLGIDSIKRVEIFGKLQQFYPEAMKETLDNSSAAAGIKTIQDIANWLDNALNENAAAFGPPDSSGTLAPTDEVRDIGILQEAAIELPRYRPLMVEGPDLPMHLPDIPPERVVLITNDANGIGSKLAEKLLSSGTSVALVDCGDTVKEASPGRYAADLSDFQQTRRLIERIHRRQGRLGAVIHLLSTADTGSMACSNLEDWRKCSRIYVKSLFNLAKASGKDLNQSAQKGTAWFSAVTAMGGSFGTDTSGERFSPLQGGIAGLVKTLAIEWAAVRCKVIDIETGEAHNRIAQIILREMAAGDAEVEVAYAGGRRRLMRIVPAGLDPRQTPKMPIDSDWVVVATGGARGITAATMLDLAHRYRPTIVLAGKSLLPEAADDPHTRGIDDPRELKKTLLEKLRQNGDASTPAAVEAAYVKLVKRREIQSNMAALKATGASVEYVSVDVCDELAFGRFIDRVYETYGRLDLFIHGAGVIEDKLIEDKSPASFDRVFDTKVDSAFVLSRKLRADSLQGLVFFSSVSGRFGSRGQNDYAAANDVLNKMAVYLNRKWPGRICAINWGPWAGGGMVSSGIKQQFESLGVQLIDPAAGRSIVARELQQGRKPHAEVIIGGGPWQRLAVRPATPSAAGYPLLNGARVELGTDGSLKLVRTLDIDYDRYLNDHRLDGKPVFPVAMAVEMMAEALQQAFGHVPVIGFENLKVLKGIALDGPLKDIHLIARPMEPDPDKSGNKAYDLSIESVESPGVVHYRATVRLGTGHPSTIGFNQTDPSELTPFPLTVQEAYRKWLFHGPAFQGISRIDGINDRGMVAVLRTSSCRECVNGNGDQKWLVDPVLFDSGLQLIILWLRHHFDVTPLPTNFKAYYQYHPIHGDRVLCHLEAAPQANGRLCVSDIYFVDANQRVMAWLHGLETAASKELNRLAGN